MYKNVKMLRQLRYILSAFLTNPNSLCTTTSIYFWFLVSLRYSLKLCFLMPIASTWLATNATEKICNQFNLFQTNRSTPQSTHLCDRLAQSAFLLSNNMVSPKPYYLLCSSPFSLPPSATPQLFSQRLSCQLLRRHVLSTASNHNCSASSNHNCVPSSLRAMILLSPSEAAAMHFCNK